ncbi:hypothetical protein WR25_03558 [Diploscapter pachys]|uniref:SID1 transmembrane family member 1 n=1 Tax=Diploscapter pachys TaxID=2018661 RepID=A0A2A2K4D0_9BILA|nr:hypothetical protein WR25_03558 [Diploscapter pachys]
MRDVVPVLLLAAALSLLGLVCGNIDGIWNHTYAGVQTKSGSNLTIYRYKVQQNTTARFTLSSLEASPDNSLLAVFRQKSDILSVQESEYLSVEINSFKPIHYTLNAFILNDFHLVPNKVHSSQASPVEPVYFRYHIPEEVDSVLIHVDSNSTTCMYVSVQKINCPVFDLENNVVYRGLYQTMTTSASIAVERREYPSFYLVFVVHHDDDKCHELMDIKPRRQNSTIRVKHFNVSIENSTNENEYILAVCSALAVIAIIYLGTSFYICYDSRIDRMYYDRGAQVLLNDEFSLPRNEDERMQDDDSIHSYDCVQDMNTEPIVARQKRHPKVADFSLKEFEQRDRKYRIYPVSLLTLGLFYGLPVVQLVLVWQRTVKESGNLDICYYNFRCAKPYGEFFAFNNILSNCGYILLGLLLIIMNKEKEYRMRSIVERHPILEAQYGIPQHFGLNYAIGLAVIMEGILSASYHICPSETNYQFDTSFMYAIGLLGMLKIYQLRHPDVNANAHVSFAVLAAFILLAMCGVYMHNSAFWLVFAVIYFFAMLFISLEFYYKGGFRFTRRGLCHSIKYTLISSKCCSCFIPYYRGRFVCLFLGNLANFSFLAYGLIHMPKDFASFLLFPFIANLFLYLTYYIVMKYLHREKMRLHALIFLLLAFICWGIAGYFFLNSVSDWSKSPASSRELNRPCILLSFYDNHDMWHFFSSVAIFLSFSLIDRIDDDLTFIRRDEIAVF